MPEFTFNKFCSTAPNGADKVAEIRVVGSSWTCADQGLYDLNIGVSPQYQLTVADVDQLAWGVALCWAVAWSFRFIARQIPRPR